MVKQKTSSVTHRTDLTEQENAQILAVRVLANAPNAINKLSDTIRQLVLDMEIVIDKLQL